jgi:hypothetical protein
MIQTKNTQHTNNVQRIALTLIVASSNYKKVIDSGFWKTPYTIILLELNPVMNI